MTDNEEQSFEVLILITASLAISLPGMGPLMSKIEEARDCPVAYRYWTRVGMDTLSACRTGLEMLPEAFAQCRDIILRSEEKAAIILETMEKMAPDIWAEEARLADQQLNVPVFLQAETCKVLREFHDTTDKLVRDMRGASFGN